MAPLLRGRQSHWAAGKGVVEWREDMILLHAFSQLICWVCLCAYDLVCETVMRARCHWDGLALLIIKLVAIT
jgi:hypothetical protein